MEQETTLKRGGEPNPVDTNGLCWRVLKGYEVLGLEHPNRLTNVSNLGVVLSRQGKYGEAEALHRRNP
ncbi:unnamed protein product [Penicillium camemberti]|uniref:Str. FM013 n=1 Tax=Penicillium camemberti (strain FM 013) TaxID=1429867 RepID=A0A0G4PN30_PENC3|nr:unnamed protein product [Penicillium camemberti]